MNDSYGFEQYLAFYCSPVLIGIKPANLFSYPISQWKEIKVLLSDWNYQLAHYEKCIIPLAIKGTKIMFFVYDSPLLEQQLGDLTIMAMLESFGYTPNSTITDKLLFLSHKLQTVSYFPHEIGLFLGYPIGDVIGFIYNQGQNYKYSGYWKVYQNKQETIELFRTYSITRIYFYQKLKEGMNIPQLISEMSH